MPNYLRLLTPRTTVLFVCDVQECFRPSVYGFRELCTSISKMVRAAAITEMHVLSTEQNYKYDQNTAKEIGMKDLPERLNLGVFNKDKFSMVDDSVRDVLKKHKFEAVILTGTEAHACVLQTAIDLLREGVDVFVLADAVSSCNRAEIPIALEALRQAGCQITTTESILFRVMNDASDPKFKEFADLVKEHKEHSKQSLKTFLGEMEEH